MADYSIDGREMGDQNRTEQVDKSDTVEAYCFRCRMRKPMHDPTETRMKNGKHAYSGTCITCGTRMFKLAAPPNENVSMVE